MNGPYENSGLLGLRDISLLPEQALGMILIRIYIITPLWRRLNPFRSYYLNFLLLQGGGWQFNLSKAKAIIINNQSNPLSRVRSTARVTSTSPGAGAGAGAGAGLVPGWGRGSCCPPTPAAAWSSWPAPTPWCSTYTATAPTGRTHTGQYTHKGYNEGHRNP